MHRHFKGRRRHRGRSWGAVGNEVASAGWRATEKAAVGLGRWMVTDHTGLGQRLSNLPSGMGILETIIYTLAHFCIAILFAAFQGVWIVLVLMAFIWFLF